MHLSLTTLLWLSTAAYGLHIVEEFTLDWRGWARNVMRLPVDWPVFYVVNALVIVLGIVAAQVATAAPIFALAFPAVMLINGTFLHVLPVIWTRGHFSPGAITAVLLFWPLGFACYAQAAAEGHLTAAVAIGSGSIGAMLMAWPLILLFMKDRPYFRQDR